ncbi:hypothetical protein TNCT_154331 [Trichonephila clavata]|uniref:Uncharacterized protein n=1 Tax=Trichonephila clavata TaxID=2740835 RepID=A0A8X6GAP2_TRICU|nr:hypothetical protein TNCT_154331 [Trichonephila clavata]
MASEIQPLFNVLCRKEKHRLRKKDANDVMFKRLHQIASYNSKRGATPKRRRKAMSYKWQPLEKYGSDILYTLRQGRTGHPA